MTKNLARALLRIVQSPSDQTEFGKSAVLLQFVSDTGIGLSKGRLIVFNEKHKERIRSWLKADNIDPQTSLNAWSNLGRAEALTIGPDEKWAGVAVRSQRIAFKALGDRGIFASDVPIHLPPTANMEWSFAEALKTLQHDAVVVVENWEAFEHVNQLQLDVGHVSSNPLILWRGGSTTASVGAAVRFVEAFGRPVWSAPDYDPEGLAIAARLPHLAGVLAPPEDELRKLLADSRMRDRYNQQLPGALATLDDASHPDIKRLWALVRASGSALPQERLCRPFCF